MENRKRYLIIVEKPSHAMHITNAYEKMKDKVGFGIDVVCAICYVDNMDETRLPPEDLKEFVPFKLWSAEVKDCFRVHANGEHYKNRARQIDELVAKNHHDAIVNACDNDEAGELIFLYTLETLGLEAYPTMRIQLRGLIEAEISGELLALNIG